MNRNTLWAEVLVDALIRGGLRGVVLAPGSRNTPLVTAFAAQTLIPVTSLLDERGAAFFALGQAIAFDAPVAVVCTSGSAGANFFPAVVEACQSRVPLVIITADRPHEVRHSGANQTVDQVKMYGDFARWSLDLQLPEARPSELVVRNLRATAARVVASADGFFGPKGVVHLNVPFRPPLEPTLVAVDGVDAAVIARAKAGPLVVLTRPKPVSDLRAVVDILRAAKCGMLVAGPRAVTAHCAAATDEIGALAQMLGFPLLADGVSGARFGNEFAISSYESFLPAASELNPDVILRIGDMPTAKAMLTFLENARPRHYIHLSADGVWADEHQRITHQAQGGPGDLLRAIGRQKFRAAQHKFLTYTHALAALAGAALKRAMRDSWSDAVVVRLALEHAPANATVFAGNSLAVRHLDQFAPASDKWLLAYASRGASGIDGNVSTALGMGAARRGHPLIAILGDVTLYHDLNGLLAARRAGVPLTLVLLNNNGGGIFHRLPIAGYDPPFTEYFVAPHGLDFAHAAAMFGLRHVLAHDHASFVAAFAASIAASAAGRESCLIEVRTDAREDLALRARWVADVKLAVEGL